MTNQLNKYLFTDQLTRVQTVELTTAWQKALEHHQYPQAVRILLGELTAAAVLLAANLKMQGSLILQAQGDGPVRLLVVECTSELQIRATVSLDDKAGADLQGGLQSLLNAQGNGRLVTILDPKDKEAFKPYQGIVPLEGETVVEVLENYMQHSEQLDTRLCLAANDERAAGMLLQRLPAQTNQSTDDNDATEDSWARNAPIFATLQAQELLSLNSAELIKRLFWQEDLIQLPAQAVQWHCPCTRQRVAKMLEMLGQDEVQSILQEQGNIEVACQFCGHPYVFDVVDCAQLFQPGSPDITSKHLH